jgi:SAM-dependent MidA family methyltransferase
LQIADVIRERGPVTVAAFMEIALYDAEAGYYARAAQRSGRAGDFFTSVDVGPLFGELLEVQLAEMADILSTINAEAAERAEEPLHISASSASSALNVVDLVEAGAGNGRLSADILRAARRRTPAFYDRVQLHLVEASAAARAAQQEVLGEMRERLVSSSADLPASFSGVLFANELLDALPVHQVVMRNDGLREVYVDVAPDTAVLRTIEGPPSTPALAAYLNRLGITLEPGWRVEINLRASEWICTAAHRLSRGFIIVIDYGHEARELYSVTHASGTLTTFARHTMAGPERPADAPAWLDGAGDRDITAHVDFTSVRMAAEAEGLTTLGFLDQTYFLMGLLMKTGRESLSVSANEVADLANNSRHLKTLLLPGGLGSTHKVLILGKGVGAPALAGCSYRMRVT